MVPADGLTRALSRLTSSDTRWMLMYWVLMSSVALGSSTPATGLLLLGSALHSFTTSERMLGTMESKTNWESRWADTDGNPPESSMFAIVARPRVESAAALILQRGVDLDNKRRYTEALVCYQEGLQLLVNILKSNCQNLLRLSELLVKSCSNLRSLCLLTSVDGSSRDQAQWLDAIKQNLQVYKVTLDVQFSDTLHDRQIKLSNGWVIKIGRGLDYFKPPIGKFCLGLFDLDLRPCHETTVDIFHSKDVKMLCSYTDSQHGTPGHQGPGKIQPPTLKGGMIRIRPHIRGAEN
uniref:MITD1 C-terminal phospholipase D-like domain-containing protein n=1 Tax=Timema shepardi TaxID=629360 RepID=A0A7R9B0E6_TIMSH|nr:unnamed protein product [Timema shepardi]